MALYDSSVGPQKSFGVKRITNLHAFLMPEGARLPSARRSQAPTFRFERPNQ